MHRKSLLALFFLSGLSALIYEICWVRQATLTFGVSIYAYSAVLTAYMGGMAIGGYLIGKPADRATRPLHLFAALQAGLAVLVLFAFAQLPRLRLEDLFAAYSVPAEMAFEGLLSFVTLFPVTVLIGAVFPVASSLYTAEQAAEVGSKVARFTALNTAGSIAGSLLAGFLIVPALGLQRSALLLAALNLGIGFAALWFFAPAERRLRLAAAAVLVVAVGAALLLPPPRYLGYWQEAAGQLEFYKEGVETTVAVFAPSSGNPKFSTVNGRVEVPTDDLSLRAFYLLGHLPPLLRPGAQSGLMLSFGKWVPLHSMAIADYLAILRTFQSVFPTATLWYTGGSHTLLLPTPEPLTRDDVMDRFQAAQDNPAVLEDLGTPDQIARYWIMDAGQLRQFAGPGPVVRDDDAFFLPINAETQTLVQVIQLAAARANP